MSKQNIYRNSKFFENYKTLRENNLGFNEILEQPVIRSLIETLRDKTILDIGLWIWKFLLFCRQSKCSKNHWH